MKFFRSSVFALMLGAAIPAYLTTPAQAQLSADVSVEIAPPPLPYYEQPIIPAEPSDATRSIALPSRSMATVVLAR